MELNESASIILKSSHSLWHRPLVQVHRPNGEYQREYRKSGNIDHTGNNACR